uniref:Adenylosuccinate synthetase n=1 Tax=Lygus hesperus TaxID=30085 RepID=A0A0A9WEF1_LYGHE
MRNGKKILAEGANACLLDIDFGTYPYVTSSNTTIGGVFTGLGISLRHIGEIYGVVKAYTTRVGLGPFPTEVYDTVSKTLVDRGHEYGTTTGRARRCGWLDLPMLYYSIQINGFTSLNITKLDVLSTLSTIKVCVAYTLDGKQLPQGYIPSTIHELQNVQPIYEILPGWQCDISSVTSYDQLPDQAKSYINFIQQHLQVPVSYIGVGPDRINMIHL